MLKENPERARDLADEIIKNTYRTLMTRGQKGCYIWAVDSETNEYFKAASVTLQAIETSRPQPFATLPLRLVPEAEVKPFKNAVPYSICKLQRVNLAMNNGKAPANGLSCLSHLLLNKDSSSHVSLENR